MEYPSLDDLFVNEEKTCTKSSISFDMWGSCRPKNILKSIRRTARLKPLYVELLRQVLSVCQSAGVSVFVYGGTALGVYREGGRMLPHDYDIDLATLEYIDGDDKNGSLSKLANFCLQSGILISGIDGVCQYTLSSEAQNCGLRVDFRNSFCNQGWLFTNSSTNPPTVHEYVYCGIGAKRAKFMFTSEGLTSAAKQLTQLRPCQLGVILEDLSNIHVDLFTLSPHPHSPKQFLRVNWHKPAVYNALDKMFPIDAFFPLQACQFEGLTVPAPRDLKRYLTVEYNYLGRDAMYDYKSQSYVKIPDEALLKLPKPVRNIFCKYDE